jgi:RND family efflux transporter MFP subunit
VGSTPGDGAAPTGSGSLQAPPAGSVSVTADEVRRGDLVKRITANGVGEAERLLTLGAEVAGKIKNLPVVEGQWVRAGDLLAELDDTELILERDRSAEAYLNKLMVFANNQIVIPGETNAAVQRSSEGENALEFLRRYVNEEAFGTMLRQPDLEERLAELSREDLFAALAELTAQRVALERAELNLQRARIVAPFNGQVAGIEASSGPNSKSWPVVGQEVSAGGNLMMLVDPDPIRVRVEVIESEIAFVREGRRAEVTFQAYPNEVFNGTIEAIDPVVDADRKTLSVTVRLANADRRLKPGMFAQVVLDTEIFENRLLVPVEAVLLRNDRQLVFVVRGGRAQWEYVATGLENEDWIEILGDNLQEGDVVVTSGHFTLAHDVPVTIIEPQETGGDS